MKLYSQEITISRYLEKTPEDYEISAWNRKILIIGSLFHKSRAANCNKYIPKIKN